MIRSRRTARFSGQSGGKSGGGGPPTILPKSSRIPPAFLPAPATGRFYKGERAAPETLLMLRPSKKSTKLFVESTKAFVYPAARLRQEERLGRSLPPTPPPSQPPPRPTDAELAILRVLWERGPSTVRAVWEEMGRGGRDVGYTTAPSSCRSCRTRGWSSGTSAAIRTSTARPGARPIRNACWSATCSTAPSAGRPKS